MAVAEGRMNLGPELKIGSMHEANYAPVKVGMFLLFKTLN